MLISKPAAELLNSAPVNNRGSPFKLDALSPTAGYLPVHEIKFDGYRCIAVKRVREVTPRHKKVLNRRFSTYRRSYRSGVISFLDGNLSLRIHKICLHYNLYNPVLRRIF